MRIRAALSHAIQITAAAALLVASGLVSGHLGIFADSPGYVRQGEYFATRLHLDAPLAPPQTSSLPDSVMPRAIAEAGPRALDTAAARSPFYGLFLYVGAAIGSLWLVAGLQALAAAWLIRVVARVIAPERESTAYWIVMPILATASALPIFVDFAMPDVFCGLSILAAALILVAGERLSRAELGALWTMLAVVVSFHTAFQVTVAAVVILGSCGLLASGTPARRLIARAGAIAAALAVAIIATGLYQDTYRRDVGIAQAKPPFLMARILADGPGKEYLDARCPGGASPALCPFKDRGMRYADDVLWTSRHGIYGSADEPARRRMKRDEVPFVLAAIAFDPRLAITAALHNFGLQVELIGVGEALEDPSRYISRPWIDTPALRHLLPHLKTCDAKGGCDPHATARLGRTLLVIHATAFILSLAILLRLAWLAREAPMEHVDEADRRLPVVVALSAVLLLGIVLNAAINGILVGPYPRYQARVIWLAPMMAALGTLARRGLRSETHRRAKAQEGATLTVS